MQLPAVGARWMMEPEELKLELIWMASPLAAAACFDTGALNTIVQYLFNVNEKRQTRHGERGNGMESRGTCSIQFYAHICEAVVRNDIEHCVDSSLFLSPCVCVCSVCPMCQCIRAN